MNTPVKITLDNISKSYGSVKALEPMTLCIEPGEMLALLGPSGCGKTTTLRIIAGFENPDTGQIIIGNDTVNDLPPNERQLGMVFQNYSLFPHMSVGSNVEFGLKIRNIGEKERWDRTREMLKMVGLDGFENRKIQQLSGGQQQRVALARSLVTNPRILLLDEPLGALDRNLRERMQFELREIQRRLGITSIIVTHDQEEALTMSDRVAVMSAGRIVQIGSPSDVYQRPRTRFISEFLGTANIFSAKLLSLDSENFWYAKLIEYDAVVQLCVPHSAEIGQNILFAVRPENIRISNVSSESFLRATVQDRVLRGSYFAFDCSVTGRQEPVFCYSQQALPFLNGADVGLSWQTSDAIFLTD